MRVIREPGRKNKGQIGKGAGYCVLFDQNLSWGVPQVLLHNLAHNHVLHERIIVLSIVTTNEPYVDEEHLVKIRTFGENRDFYRVKLYYGFKQNIDVRRALELCVQEGLDIDPKNTSFFIDSEQVSFRKKNHAEMAQGIVQVFISQLCQCVTFWSTHKLEYKPS